MYVYIIEKLLPFQEFEHPHILYINDSLLLEHFSFQETSFLKKIETNGYTLNMYEVKNTEKECIFLCFSCTSTFTVAKILFEYNIFSPWDAILSVEQTDGRGQKEKKWDSPKGNFFGTFSLPKTPFFTNSLASLLLGAVVAEILTFPPYFFATIKWPNDIIYNNKKIAGMLLLEDTKYIFLGIGINTIRATNSVLSNALPAAALSEYLPSKDTPSLGYLSSCIIKKIQEKMLFFSKKENIHLITYIEKYLAYKGEYISVLSSTPYIAKCISITEKGELFVERENGTKEFLCTETIRPLPNF